MSQYAMTFEQIGAMPNTRFEEVWKAYIVRVALSKLDAEVARQRSSIEGSMGEKDEIEDGLQKLEMWASDTRRSILTMDEPDKFEDVPEAPGEFREDLWWKPKPEEEGKKKVITVEDTGIESVGHLGIFEPEVEIDE